MRLLLLLLMALGLTPMAHAAGGNIAIPQKAWPFQGIRAAWDKDELYRGYTVATQVCLACHSFKYVSHRDLMRVGFTEAEVKKLADALQKGVDDKLLSGMDEATAKDTFGKLPPDLSVMNIARAGLADYTYALLHGYSDNSATIAKYLPGGLPEGAYFNKYYPGHAIAMANPLSGPDLVTYHDGTAATVDQMAHDVTVFMEWTAQPERIERQRLGVYVRIYLLIFTGRLYLSKRAIWRNVKGH
jgi:ubiquinol-cytochrome c reductase cytochrome c1 subunit